MTQFVYANNAATTLAGPIAANATSVNLAAGTGALFPNPGVGQQFSLTFISAANPNVIEIAYCTGRTGDVCSITRGQEGTTPTAFIAGDEANNDLTAGTCAALIQASQLQQQTTNYAVDTGTTNSIVVTLTPAPGSLALIAGSPIRVLVKNTITGPATLTVNTLSTTTIIAQDGSAMSAGQIVANEIFEFFYNPGVGFEVISPYVLLSRANVWTTAQTMANNTPINWNNNSGSQVALLNLSANNQTVLRGGTGSPSMIFAGAGGNTLANFDSSNSFLAQNRLRAITGALGSGDPNCATILNDFVSQVGGTATFGYFYQQLPNGRILVGYGGINGTGTDVVNFVTPFPNNCLELVVMEGAPQGWGVGGTSPTIMGAQQLTAASFALYVTKWNGNGFGFIGGISYRYIAVGY